MGIGISILQASIYQKVAAMNIGRLGATGDVNPFAEISYLILPFIVHRGL